MARGEVLPRLTHSLSVNKDNMTIYWNSQLESLRMCVLACLHWGIWQHFCTESKEREGEASRGSETIIWPSVTLGCTRQRGCFGSHMGMHKWKQIWEFQATQRESAISIGLMPNEHQSPRDKRKEPKCGQAERMGSPLTWKHFVERDYGCSVQCERSPRGPPFLFFYILLPSSSSHYCCQAPSAFTPSPVPKYKRLFEGLVVRSRGEKGATPRWCQSCPFHAR